MALNIVVFLAGLALACMVLKDVFDTVVVPGGSRTQLRVAHRLVFLTLPLWKKARGRRRGVSSAFAPFILVSCFIIWMIFLAFAFGLMTYALRNDFEPHITSFFDSVYIAGSSLVTVGLTKTSPTGTARWITLGAGFCGLAVMTMAVTYLLEVQGSVSRRDTGIMKLNTSAGVPPSALTMFERFSAIRNIAAIRQVLEDARTWCATVRQSHCSHPSLIYFQSVGTSSGWPAALGAVLDMALLAEHLVEDDDLYGPAVLLREEGARMALELAAMIGVAPIDTKTSVTDLEQVSKRLESSGYAMRANPNFEAMASQRTDHMRCVDALATHLGKPTSVLIRQS